MVHVRNRLKAEKLDAKLILQVHDELIVDAEPEELEQVKKNKNYRVFRETGDLL